MRPRHYGFGARGAALEALCRVDTDASYSGQTLDTILERSSLSSKDRALATRLTYGTLQKRVFLDYQLEQVGGRNVGSLDVPVANVLRLGAYQRFFCDKIPPSAAVNEAVKSVKACGFTSASGLVNAVLRKIDPAKPAYPDDEIQALSVRYSLPAWMIYHLRKSYREESLVDILKGLDETSPVYLRVNTLRTTPSLLQNVLGEEGIQTTPAERPGGLLAEKLPLLKNSKAFSEGLFHVQDLASQTCAAALAPEKGQRVLDICAAPGGKTFTLCELMEDEGEVLACDLYPARVGLIRQGAERLGLKSIRPTINDATVYNGEMGTFDRILCDVPCSGLGVIRRKPEIRFKPERELTKYPELQKTILSTAARYLRPGGRLVYSTCTLNPAENQRVVEAFLRDRPDFALSPLFPDDPAPVRTFFPHKDGTDGFFAAAFIKEG